jgi:signal transduction histidine kinase
VTRRRWGLAALAIAATFWSLAGEWVTIHHRIPENHLLDALSGMAYLAAGIIALDRRPSNAIGVLMVAFGFTWYLGNWSNIIGLPVLPMLGVIGGLIGTSFVAHIALSYPTGRLRGGFDRVVLGAIYTVGIGTSLIVLLTYDPRAAGCTRCGWEPALLPSTTGAPIRAAVLFDQRAGSVLALLFVAAIIVRWRRSTIGERRSLAPLWVASSILALAYLIGSVGSPDPLDDSFSYLLSQLQGILLMGLPIVFLWGLLSTRLARSAVGDLVIELGRPLLPGELRASLARALGDQSLDLLYALDGAGPWVDVDGQPRSLPEGCDDGQWSRRVTVVEANGSPVAALIHDPAVDQGLVRAAATAAGMTIENERLHAQVRAQLEEVLASRQRIVEAADRERRRVERNLHDGAQQRLLTLALSLAMLRDRGGDNPTTAASLADAAAELRLAIEELRELARGIHPAILTEEGLPAAVEALADRSLLPVRVRTDFDARLPEPIEATAYFVVSEALANVAKYARASSVRVELSRDGEHLRVEVTDDGIGGADPSRGSGLRGLEDRVSAVRGTLRIASSPGRGTRVVAEIPCLA